jgi:hypothetical protein
MTDTVTIVRSYGPRLAKRITPGGVEPYDNAKRVDLFERRIGGLADLEELLRQLEGRPDCAVVRGAVADRARIRGVRRLLYPDLKTGEQPTLAERPRHWLPLDFDALPVPPELDVTDLVACGRLARSLLPAAFHAATCLIQATGQHAVNGVHLRLWFWLARASADIELRIWLKTAPVDHSLC